jgi:hypothetical protein
VKVARVVPVVPVVPVARVVPARSVLGAGGDTGGSGAGGIPNARGGWGGSGAGGVPHTRIAITDTSWGTGATTAWSHRIGRGTALDPCVAATRSPREARGDRGQTPRSGCPTPCTIGGGDIPRDIGEWLTADLGHDAPSLLVVPDLLPIRMVGTGSDLASARWRPR